MSYLKPPVSDADNMQGNKNAVIELVEFGDYQCEHCGHAYPIIKMLQKKLGANLKFVFRNFPLSEMHPNALNTAVAAETASAQDKFWQMHDVIFENQQHLTDANLINYAAKIGLDIEQFKADFQTPKYIGKVDADFESGVRSGVNGTPSFYINGEKYNGNWEEDEFLEYLQTFIS